LIQQIAIALKTELAIAGEDSRLYADSMATALGAHLLRRYGVENSVVKEYRGGLTNYQLKIVIEYIQEHLDFNLNLDLLASLINISPHYFASLFKQSTGTSPHKYITSCRLEKAKILLRQCDDFSVISGSLILMVGLEKLTKSIIYKMNPLMILIVFKRLQLKAMENAAKVELRSP
jgi:AraC-like DNA-binding protein